MKFSLFFALAALLSVSLTARADHQNTVQEGVKALTVLTETLREIANVNSSGEAKIVGNLVQKNFDRFYYHAKMDGLTREQAVAALAEAIELFARDQGMSGDEKEFVIEKARAEVAKYGVERDN